VCIGSSSFIKRRFIVCEKHLFGPKACLIYCLYFAFAALDTDHSCRRCRVTLRCCSSIYRQHRRISLLSGIPVCQSVT
jgi:hypothetical protein